MLTVKHDVNGCEDIHVAPHGVTFYGPFSAGNGVRSLMIKGDDDALVAGRCLYNGTAYVMNEAGATVGIYHLDNPPEFSAPA